MEAFRLAWGIEENGIIAHARGAKIIGHAAQGQHQNIVVQGAFGQYRLTFIIAQWRQGDGFFTAIDTAEGTELKTKMMVKSMGSIAQRIDPHIQAATGDLMQQRLPQMAIVAIDQRYLGLLFFAIASAQLGCQLQAAGAPTHYNNSHNKILFKVEKFRLAQV